MKAGLTRIMKKYFGGNNNDDILSEILQLDNHDGLFKILEEFRKILNVITKEDFVIVHNK